MINQIFKVSGGWVGESPVNLVKSQDQDIYIYAGDEPLTVGFTIGLWDGVTGEPINLDLPEYETIRPLGNDVDGSAVDSLAYHSFMGHAYRNLEPGRRYPLAESPFDLEVRHQEITEGTWQGWGWRAEIHGDAGSRDPGVRAIGIYSDSECTQYLYTTGAFVQGVSSWQVDSNGQPLTVWYTECPLGQLKPTRGDWHIAILYAALQEGKKTLLASQDSFRYLFFEKTQIDTQPISGEPTGAWVDTGATIIALAGQVYRTSSILTGLIINQPLRLGLTLETKFNGYWPVVGTPSDYIQITPYVSVSIGTKVYKWV
jgi:hypothetical protein